MDFARYCWMGEMEFRANFFTWIVVNIIWGAFTLLFVNIIFTQVNTLAGWSKPDAMVLASVHILFTSLLWIVILPNATAFHELIRKGELDFCLIKPLNLRFIVSTKVFEFDQIPRLLVTPLVISYLLKLGQFTPSLIQVVTFVFLILVGLFIFYNFFFTIMTTNFWFVNTFNLENLFESLVDVGRFPTQVFSGLLKIIFTYIAPVAYIATFPAQVLIGRGSWSLVIIALVLGVVSFIISQLFWNFALRHYSSASS